MDVEKDNLSSVQDVSILGRTNDTSHYSDTDKSYDSASTVAPLFVRSTNWSPRPPRNHVTSTNGSKGMLIKSLDANWCSRVCEGVRKLFLVSEHHPFAYEYFRSFPALVAERQRHLMENKNIIHPLSIFSLVWSSFMIIVNLYLIVLSSLRLFIIIEPSRIVMDANDIIIVVLQAICIIDMMTRFNTGIVGSESEVVELDRRIIAWKYIRSFWLIDLLSCFPLSFLMLLTRNRSRQDYLIPDILPLARTVRIITVLSDLQVLLRMVTTSHIWYRIVRHILLFILAIHFFTCLLFMPSVFRYYVYGYIPRTYTGFLDTITEERNFYDLSIYQLYVKGMFVAVSAFFSTGFHMFKTRHKSEIIVHCLILLFGTMFKMYTIVFALRTYMTLYNSSVRYQELMDQVEKYMRYQQFPAPLMKRLRDFYMYQFEERYFKESVALGCLSAQLQNEIRLHTYQKWIEKVPVLKGLSPNFLGSLLGCLEPEVYMSGDLIFHVGDHGKAMYFISAGTVALYSMRGVEIYHFQDGDFFGALSLITPGNRRVTTLVAIEITHLYRLTFECLREISKHDSELSDRIQRVTSKRITAILKVDELILVEGSPSSRMSEISVFE